RLSFAPWRPVQWPPCSLPAPVEALPTVAVEVFDVAPSNDEIVTFARRNMGADISRDFRDDVRLGHPSLDHSVNQPIGTQVFDASDSERKGRIVAPGFDLLGKEGFGTETEPGLAVLEEVHRRRSDEGGDECVGRIAVDFLRRADLTHLSLVEHGDAVAKTHCL